MKKWINICATEHSSLYHLILEQQETNKCSPFFLFFNHFICLHFKWSPSSRFPLHKPPSHRSRSPSPFDSMRVLFHSLTHSCLTALAFPYAGASSLHNTMYFPSCWCQIRSSSVTCVSGAMAPFLYTLWQINNLVQEIFSLSSWCLFHAFSHSREANYMNTVNFIN